LIRRAALPVSRRSRILPEVSLYTLADDLPELRDAVMVASFDGWVDAAEAASGAVAHVAGDSRMLATFDPDALFDYRSRRPILDVNDGRLSNLSWPDLTIRHARAGECDLLVFSGAEPDLRWRELAGDVAELAGRLGVTQWISLGAVPAAVPHTRPVPVLATASRDGLLSAGEMQGPEGLLRVPSAAISALEMAVSSAGTPAVGFFAQVPPYASVGYAAASIALLDRLGGHLGVAFDLDALVAEEREQRARYDAAMTGDAILRETVSRLEEMVGDAADERLPSGDELAREIQRFLNDRPDEAGPP
jgi:hypothetical protein